MRSRAVATFAGALLVGGLIAGPTATPVADAQVPEPAFSATLGSPGSVDGAWFAPDTTVTISISNVPDVTADTDADGFFHAPGLEIVPGQTVTVCCSPATPEYPTGREKVLQVSSLVVTGANFGDDILSGTAHKYHPTTPDEVEVSIFDGQPATHIRTEDVTGEVWTTDFTPYDLSAASSGFLTQTDVDGDRTSLFWVAPNPHLEVNVAPEHGYVAGDAWLPNAPITISVDGAPQAPVTADAGGFFNVQGLAVTPGQTVTARDGDPAIYYSERSLVVAPLAVTAVDLTEETVSGTACAPTGNPALCEPGDVTVAVWNGSQWAPERTASVDGSGAWSVEFGPFDLAVGMLLGVEQRETDGDRTSLHYSVQAPQPPPFILVNAQQDIVVGDGWPNLATVTLTIAGRPDLVTPPLQVHVNSGPGGIDFQFFPVPFDLQPGMEVSVTDGTITRTHTALDIRAASVNTALETVSGYGPADGAVDVSVFDQGFSLLGIRHVAAPGGEWLANFQAAGSDPDEQGIVNLTGNQYVIARTPADPQGNASYGGIMPTPPPSADIIVFPNVNLIDGQQVDLSATGWPTTAEGSLGRTLFVTQCAIGDGGSDASCDPTTLESFELNPDGTLPAPAKFTVKQTLAINWPSAGTSWNCTTSPCGLRGAVYPGDTEVASPGWEVMELPGQNTVNFGGAPPGGAVIDLDPTANLANGQEITLTGAGWPAGKTLYVSECRLDMGLSGDTCDPNTTQTYTVEPDGTLPTSPASTYIVTRDISTNSGAVLCGAFVNSCGLVAVTWPGEPGIGSPSRLDMPGNNVINFSGAVARVPVFYLSTAPSGPVAADVNGFGWARNALVTIEVDGTARSPDATAYTSPFGSFTTSGSTVVVEVGDVVTVSDGISTKTQVVPPLTVTEVNIGADKVMGTADPDGLEPFVQVEPTPSPLAETAASMTDGDWTANFSPASDDPYDIVGGTWGIAFQYDDDGDATATRWVATDDGDGVDEPPGYDGNGDDIADAQQANVTSLANAVDQQLVTIASPPGTSLTSVAAIDPSTLPAEGRPSLDRLPIGVLSFEVYVEDEGDAADVVLYLPAGVTADAYFKYHDAWSQYPDVTFAGSQVTLHLVDGEAGDGDDAANSVIVDPGAPADVFDFAGFFAPVNNLPVRNSVKAGKAIPVKFSLGGDQGLDIFAAGSPTSRSVDCNSQAPTDEIETTIESPGASRLTYDAESDRYQLVWKTDKAWRGCRLLTLKLRDGTTHRAIFEFK